MTCCASTLNLLFLRVGSGFRAGFLSWLCLWFGLIILSGASRSRIYDPEVGFVYPASVRGSECQGCGVFELCRDIFAHLLSSTILLPALCLQSFRDTWAFLGLTGLLFLPSNAAGTE